MSVSQIHQKLEKGYLDIEKGNVEDAASAFMLKDNYSVFYTICKDQVIVTDVLYTASDIGARLRGVSRAY